MLLDYLKEHYADGEPIFTEDIQIEEMSRSNFIQQLKTLTDNGKIRRYEKGIYYIPKKTRFVSSSGPSAETIARYKYISRLGKTNGYYSGSTFANLIGLSMQVPVKQEIVSNNIAAIVREVPIGKQTFIVRRSKVPVTNKNVRTLQLLELLKNLDAYLDDDYDSARKKITAFVYTNRISKSDIDHYIRLFPDSTFRYYYEMGLEHVLA